MFLGKDGKWIHGNNYRIAESPLAFYFVLNYNEHRLSAKMIDNAKIIHGEGRFMEHKIIDYVVKHPDFSTEEFFVTLQKDNPDIGRSTVYKYLKEMCDKNIITRAGRGRYLSSAKKQYNYPISETAKEIAVLINEKFPHINYQIWETYQMNEFINHQLAHNTIIVDVENMLDDTVFNYLFAKYPHVLYRPSSDEYYKYRGDETIVVKRLISEAPATLNEYHLASLEKILVDLFGKGITGSIIPRSEYTAIFEDGFSHYNINTAMLFRYARRRGNAEQIRDFIQEKTGIVLEQTKIINGEKI